MSVRSGQSLVWDFALHANNAMVDADTTPTGTLVVNGTDNGASVTVTHKSTGIYKFSVILPSLSSGNQVQMRISATISGVATAAYVFGDSCDDDESGGSGGSGLSGPSSVTLSFVDESSDPVPLVDFTILGQGSDRADSDGTAAFGLDDGSYTVVARPTNGVLFENYSLTVDGTTSATITGEGITISPGTSPQTTAYLTTYNGNGDVQPHVTITFALVTPPGDDGAAFPLKTFTARSDDDGLLTVSLLRSSTYRAYRETDSVVEFTTPDAATFELPQIPS